jgi:hypothetical protein
VLFNVWEAGSAKAVEGGQGDRNEPLVSRQLGQQPIDTTAGFLALAKALRYHVLLRNGRWRRASKLATRVRLTTRDGREVADAEIRLAQGHCPLPCCPGAYDESGDTSFSSKCMTDEFREILFCTI